MPRPASTMRTGLTGQPVVRFAAVDRSDGGRSAFVTNDIPLACTHPDNGVQLGHGHLFGPVDRSGDLLLMLLREKWQNLGDDGVQPLRYLRLKRERTNRG